MQNLHFSTAFLTGKCFGSIYADKTQAFAKSNLILQLANPIYNVMQRTILIVSSFEKERGSGHLVRCCTLAQNLKALGLDTHLYIPTLGTECGRALKDAQQIFLQCGVEFSSLNIIVDKDKISKQNWDMIVVDLFQTELNTFLLLKDCGTMLAIDEGGLYRNNFDFLLDLLPVYSKIKPNMLRCDLLHMPKNRLANKFVFADKNYANGNKNKLRVLISFGCEDAAGLGYNCAYAINNSLCDITLVQGILCKNKDTNNLEGITVVEQIQNMREHLCEYDLLITHFGISAFEALYAGISVVLVSPTTVHENTAKMTGFFSCGIGKQAADNLDRYLFEKNKSRLNSKFIRDVSQRCAELALKYNLDADVSETLADYVVSLMPQAPRLCPVCGTCSIQQPTVSETKKKQKISHRFPRRTYNLCPVCGMYFLKRTVPPKIQYNEEYFFENYKKQYGKTYLEDFPSLLALAKKRFFHIKQFADTTYNTKQKLLDIGCAYGAFLQAAHAESFIPFGIDISQHAVDYVCNTLNMKAQKMDFEKENILVHETYKVVTLWYVIEHFESFRYTLLKIKSILQESGVLAFSTPSGRGISARKSPHTFLEQSPSDHRIILVPQKIKKLLKCFGFDVRKIVSTGHHPERFPIIGKYLKNQNTKAYKFIFFISRILKLGDTFEVYAVKE
ncbi:MAG: hypothetical protein Ta2B_03110 [Termitinemataceae bacterium]|nr:MAG: hypothetical protein Ta2B_03110 [Termitinemataceae bacterium]